MNTPAAPAELPPNGSLLDELDLIEEPKAAIAIDVATQTLISWRKAGTGPDYIMVGRRVLYSRAKLKAWLEAGGTRVVEHDPPKVSRDLVTAMNAALGKTDPPKPKPPRAKTAPPVRKRRISEAAR